MTLIYNLSERLRTVKESFEKWNCIADIGCDHGYVSISLIKEGYASKVIACDVNEGPLKAARQNIDEAGLSGVIETRLGDGLHKISTEDCVDALVIAGMGGRLMSRILEEGLEVVDVCKQLVLQPQSEHFLVRQWLREHGYMIFKEAMVEDMGKFYWVIDARKGEEKLPEDLQTVKIYDDYSGYLLEKKDPVLKKYLENQLMLCKQYLSRIEGDKGDNLRENIGELEKALYYFK